MKNLHEGADWVRRNAKIAKASSGKGMSGLGVLVANILGYVWRGIYHLDVSALSRVDWSNKQAIVYVHCGSISTYDSKELTELVILAHDNMLRLEIEAATHGYLRLTFSPRPMREGGACWDNCPTLESMAASTRKVTGEPKP